MLAMKWLLMAVGVAMFGTAAGVVAYMVPTDGRNFFASDVLRSAFSGATNSNDTEDTDRDGPAPARKRAQVLKTK